MPTSRQFRFWTTNLQLLALPWTWPLISRSSRQDLSMAATSRSARDRRRQRLQQPLAMLIHIDQREGRQEPLMIYPDAAIPHLGVLEGAPQDARNGHSTLARTRTPQTWPTGGRLALLRETLRGGFCCRTFQNSAEWQLSVGA